jgi:hypothetical protein
MPLSRDNTAASIWREAVRDINAAGIFAFEKHLLVNRAVSTVAGEFYDLMSISYMTEVNATLGGTAKYETGTGGTYTVTTKTLNFTTPSAHFDSTDIGKEIMFRISTSIYLGVIGSVTTTHEVVFQSTVYPTADATFNEALICGTMLSASTFSIASLRIMRTHAMRIELATTASGATIKAGTTREVNTFVGSGRNSKTIVWTINGDSIDFAIGDSLVNAGTLKIYYPRVPILVTADTDYVDLPDGTPMEIAIIYLRGLIQRRLGLPLEDNEGLLSKKIADLYMSVTGEANQEVVKDKVLALK